jgi:acetyl-CoA decarbonylase/synthase complex subunit gamma
MLISDTMDAADVDGRLKRFAELEYERVGLTLRPELIALKSEFGDAATFTALVNKVKEGSDASLILVSDQPAVIVAALESCAEQKPLIHAATADNYEEMAALALNNCCPLAVRAGSLDELAQLTEKLSQLGVKDIVIDSGAGSFRQAFTDQVAIRRAALLKKFRPLGFPTIIFTSELTNDPMQEALMAATFVAKYGGIIVLSDFQGESLFPLLVERMNLFTDPQRPLATTEGIYEIGGPGESSPVLLTCNFSLTYFIVTGETENAKVPGYLLVKDTEGLSVMTAWAAGKFSADIIGPFIKKCGIADKVTHRKLIIPGYVAAESGGLEEELPDWEILVGPREAAHIPAYLKTWQP